MSIAYQASDPSVQGQELKWRSLIVRKEDTQIATVFTAGASGEITINVQQPIAQGVNSALSNYIPGCHPIVQVVTLAGALRVISGTPSVSGNTIVMSAANSNTVTSLAATDAVIVSYVILEA